MPAIIMPVRMRIGLPPLGAWRARLRRLRLRRLRLLLLISAAAALSAPATPRVHAATPSDSVPREPTVPRSSWYDGVGEDISLAQHAPANAVVRHERGVRMDDSRIESDVCSLPTHADAQYDGAVASWEVGEVTQMACLFSTPPCPSHASIRCTAKEHFNADLSRWQTSKVTHMHYMFRGLQSFNSSLSRWDVQRVQSFNCTFRDTAIFDSDLNAWDVGASTSVRAMRAAL